MAEAQGQAAAPSAANTEAFIAAMIDAEAAPPPAEKKKQEAHEQQPESQPDAEDNAQIEGDDASQEQAPEEEETAETAEIPLETLESIPLDVTVKGEDGKDIVEKVTVKDLKLGYMRQQDYSRKTAETARQREQIGQERQGIQAERGQFVNSLQQLQSLVVATVAPEFKNVDWNYLAANNPAEYVRLTNRKEQITQTLQGIAQQLESVNAKNLQTKGQSLKDEAAKTVSALKAEIPHWNDDYYSKVLDNAVKNGVRDADAKAWVDLGIMKLAIKAYQFDQLQDGKPLADKKLVNVPKVIKPGAQSDGSPKQKAASAAMKRLRESGKITDLAAIIAAQM